MRIGLFHTAFIGDVILTGLLIEAIFCEGHEIILFTKAPTHKIFEVDLRLTKVLPIQKKSGIKKILSILNIANSIHSEKLDLLLVPHRSLTSTLCAFFSRVPLSIGFKNACASFLYKKTVPFLKDRHECIRYLQFLTKDFSSRESFLKYEKIARPFLRYHPKVYVDFDKNFTSFKNLHKNFFILAPGSVWATKKYPLKHWACVIQELLKTNLNMICVLSGSFQDRSDIEEILSYLNLDYNHKRIINTCGLFSLSEFAILISRALFVLCNDSSPAHFASAFNVPVLSVFGPTVPSFGFAPTSEKSFVVQKLDLNCRPCSIHGQNKCPLKHHACMKDLKPEEIIGVVKKELISNNL